MSTGPITGTLSPVLFQDAIDKLATKTVVASSMKTKDWMEVPAAIREASFWSAGVTNAKFVQRAQDLLLDYLKQTVVSFPDGKKKLKVGGRAEFVKTMMEFVKSEKIPRELPGTIHDIGGSQRLRLVFDTQIRMAEGYGYWKQGQDPAILEAYPCMRFIRVVKVKSPRPVHQSNIGQVRRKDDLAFWLAMNSPVFGGFGVPWGPWGFNTGCDTEDVNLKESAEAGYQFKPGETPKMPAIEFNEFMQTSVAGMSPDLKAKLATTFKDVAELEGDNIVFKKEGELEKLAKLVAPPPPPEPEPVPEPEPPPPPEPKAQPIPAPTSLYNAPEGQPAVSIPPTPATPIAPIKPVQPMAEAGKPAHWSELPELQLQGTDLHSAVPGWEKSHSDVKYGGLGYGGIIFDDQGRIQLREPKDHFGGYHWTFAKGGLNKGEDITVGALREVFEETGTKAQIVGVLEKGFTSNGPKSFFFLMKQLSQNLSKMDKETAGTQFVTYAEAKALIGQTTHASGMKRDLKILDAAFAAYNDLMGGKKQSYLEAVPLLDTSKPIALPPKLSKATPVTKAFPDSLDGMVKVKELGGSTQAQLWRDGTGRQYVVKKGGQSGQAAEEYAANQAYRKAGVRVPESKMMMLDGKQVMVNEYITGESLADWQARAKPAQWKAMNQKLAEHFVTDALFGNWDVVGPDLMNVIVDAKGNPWRIDNGGSFRYRAQGGLKGDQWNERVDELASMRNYQTNPATANIFWSLSDEDIKKQVAHLLKSKSAILATVPAELRPMLSKRFDTLEKLLTSDTDRGSPISPEQVRASRINGRASLNDKGDIEDMEVLLWEEKSSTGTFLRASLKLSPKADSRVSDILGSHVQGGIQGDDAGIEKANLYFKTILLAAKTHNNAIATGGMVNQTKIDNLRSAKTALQTISGIADADLEHLKSLAERVMTAIKEGKNTGLIETPKWRGINPIVTETITRQVTKETWNPTISLIKKGVAQQTDTPNTSQGNLGISLKVTDGDLTARFMSGRSTSEMAPKGLMELTVAGGATDANIKRVFDFIKSLGVDTTEPTDAYREYTYIKRVAYLNNLTEGADWLRVEQAATDDAKRLAARAFVKDKWHMTPPEKPTADYDWRGTADQWGNGHITYQRFDITGAEIEKQMPGHFIGIGSDHPLEWFKSIINGGGQLTSTMERYRRGIDVKHGASVSSDRGTGGANYIFTRIAKGKDYVGSFWKNGSNIEISTKVLGRADAVSYQTDQYGSVLRFKERLNTVKQYKGATTNKSNETNFKGVLSVFDPSVKYLILETLDDVQELVKYTKQQGYSQWPDGRKLEDVIVTRAKWKSI